MTFTKNLELGQGWRLSLGQVVGRAIAGGLDRLHQATNQVEELLTHLAGIPTRRLGQSAGLAQEMRKVANAVEVRIVDAVTIAIRRAW